MARKLSMAYLNSLQDTGFQQAAAATGRPFVPTVPTTPTTAKILQPTGFENIRDYGFEQAAEAAGQPFISAAVTITEDDPSKSSSRTGGAGTGDGGTGGALGIDEQNALDVVRGYLKQWNLESLENIVLGWMRNKTSADAALMKLRGEGAYKERFSGMELREKAGLAPIDEATYLALEDDYDAWARYYGVEGSFGTTAVERQKNFANLIGKNVSAPVFKEFADTVSTRINNADPAIKTTLNRFYGITDTDLKNYLINPSENIKALEAKVTAAEIGAAGIAQGLNVSRGRAEEFVTLDIDQDKARTGFQRIARSLPEGQLLSGIYGEEGIRYTQETAEDEEFKGLESAARKRRRLASLAEASFEQSSAITQGSLSGRGTAGQV
jgi:hypothetical protein